MSNPQSWRCISRRTLTNLNVRRLKFRRAIPIWHQHSLPAVNIHAGGVRPTALALADAPGVHGPAYALPAVTDLERPSASSGPTSPSAPGTAVLTLSAPTRESTRPIMEASETSIGAPTAESTNTISPDLETRRHAPLQNRQHRNRRYHPKDPRRYHAYDPQHRSHFSRLRRRRSRKRNRRLKTAMKGHRPCRPSKLPSRPAGNRRFKHVRWGTF